MHSRTKKLIVSNIVGTFMMSEHYCWTLLKLLSLQLIDIFHNIEKVELSKQWVYKKNFSREFLSSNFWHKVDAIYQCPQLQFIFPTDQTKNEWIVGCLSNTSCICFVNCTGYMYVLFNHSCERSNSE